MENCIRLCQRQNHWESPKQPDEIVWLKQQNLTVLLDDTKIGWRKQLAVIVDSTSITLRCTFDQGIFCLNLSGVSITLLLIQLWLSYTCANCVETLTRMSQIVYFSVALLFWRGVLALSRKIDTNRSAVDISIYWHLSEWQTCIFSLLSIVVFTCSVSSTTNNNNINNVRMKSAD